jgi:hypothetical protein
VAKQARRLRMRRPDCKIKITKEDVVDSNFVDAKGDGVGYEEPVYECPKCNCEFNKSDLDD